MGYQVDYAALGDQLSAFENAVSGWNAAISSVMSAEAAIVSSTNISGNTANRIKAYLSEAYPHIEGLFSTLLSTFCENFQAYIDAYKQEVDCAGDTHIDSEELSERKSGLQEKQSKLQEIGTSAETAIKSVSDIAPVTSPEFSTAVSAIGEVSKSIDDLDTRINNLESAHSSDDFGDIDALISKLSSYLNGLNGAEWSAKASFVAGSASSLALFLSTGIVLYDYAEYAASGGTDPVVGQIRYVYQGKSVKDYGWGATDSSTYANKGSTCNAAVESMALSYMGIDKSAGEVAGNTPLNIANYADTEHEYTDEATGKTVHIDSYSVGYNTSDASAASDISERVQAFMQDNGAGEVSPVMVRYSRYSKNSGNGHWLILVSQNEDGSYVAVGPGSYSQVNVTVRIDGESGAMTVDCGDDSKISLWLDRYGQYTEVGNADNSAIESSETPSAVDTASNNCSAETESKATAEIDNSLVYSRTDLLQDNAAACPVQE